MNNIVELLKKQAEKTPEKILFSDSENSISYQEAYQKVSGIATYLKKKGIEHQPILVPVTRHYQTLLLFFGIAYSNNYYVPISEDTPKERRKDILQIGDISYGFDFHEEGISCLSSEEALSCGVEEQKLNELSKDFSLDAPLYLIFTSGSTGKPKGVMKSHRNVLAFLENFKATFSIPNEVRIANQTPFYFDASAKDIYLTLALEGTLYLPDKTLFALPTKIVEYLDQNQIDMILWVPSALVMIAKIRALSFLQPKKLRHVFFIGEVFPPKYLNLWIKAMKETHFYNLYGSSEIAGACLYHEITDLVPQDKNVPLGRPLMNNKVTLEDGEICISSEQVAIGYLKDEEKNRLTFRNEEGKTVLHTGDYAQYDENGDLVFHSRKDYQIKHLGYRIELQDIEATLSSLDYLSACCCLYRKDKDRIVLFVSLSKEIPDEKKVILTDCRRLLPEYMVPNQVEILDQMPLNANGKTDRALLAQKLENS